MTFTNIKAAVFDLDGTLIDSAPDLLIAIEKTLLHFDVSPAPAEKILPGIAIGSDNMLMNAFEIAGKTVSDARFDEAFAWFVDYYAAHSLDETRLYPGVEEVLDVLHARRIKLAICTNKRMSLTTPILDGLGLSDKFPVVTGRDSYPVRKPDPLPLLGTLAQLDVAPGEALMIGDTATDIETAKAAGVSSVAVSFGYGIDPQKLGADELIDRMVELLPLIVA